MDNNKKQKRKKIIFWAIVQAILWTVVGVLLSPIIFNTQEVSSPSDFIKKEQLEIYPEKICILGDFMLSGVLDTNSMDPLMDEDSIIISKKIKSLDEIKQGDIISFKAQEGNIIIHRVYKKYDNYVITKGDNNLSPDPYHITFDMIVDVVVGILY